MGEGTGRREKVEEGRGRKRRREQEDKLNQKETSVEFPTVNWPIQNKTS